MKIIIEIPYPDGTKKFSYEDTAWDHPIGDFTDIIEGLMKQAGYTFEGKLEIVD